MGVDICPQARGHSVQSVLFGRPHRDELPSPRQQGAQLLRVRVRQGTRRGTHGVGTMRQGADIEAIGLGL